MRVENIIGDPLLFYHDLAESIVAALEAKDANTADHSCRVSEMAERFCSLLNMNRQEKQIIHMAAHLHDIGKIGIPDHILGKMGRLTAEEWEIMKLHPEIGAKILNKSGHLHQLSDIVLHHHERWDGQGYPSGLNTRDIPLGSRVIALCDSVDAMLRQRPYRPAMSGEQCKQEISVGSGIMYDPVLAGLVLENWDMVILPEKEGFIGG